MPRQHSAGRTPFTSASKSSTQKANRKHKQRGLDAFAIASAENPDRNGLKRHRLGDVDHSDEPRAKKRRSGEDEDAEEDDDDNHSGSERGSRDQRQSKQTYQDEDGLDDSGGSDSEGHEWRMGHVSDDQDEELDSDEAFGESDEERFEGFTFRGSLSHQKKQRRQPRTTQGMLDLDENEEAESDESDSDSLGEDAVDLATMLDQEQEGDSDSGSEEDDEGGDDEDDSSSFTSDDEVDSDNEDRLQKLQDLVTSLPRNTTQDLEEEQDVDDAQVSRERLLGALRGMSNLDPAFARSAKRLADGAAESSATGKPSSLVKAPLPKRQQDRIDREAAYVKAKETLNRWIDTVKHNRRAEHLSFPLKDPQAQEALGTSRMVTTGGDEEPRNELERAIQTIMQESGLATVRGPKDDEAQIREAEELQAKKMPLEEVMARRTELRKQRDLLFREEIRARRIKKIKSKAYRRVHRKEKEKLAQKDKDLLAAAGLEDSEEEREKNDRRRAEERMGARHRNSKWAKGVKKSGRGAWDDDARAGVTDMARRNEDLRKRIEGRKVRGSDDESADFSSDDSDDDDSEDDGNFKLKDALDHVELEEAGTKTGLSSMKFMQRADAARKKQNDEAVAALRRTVQGDDESGSDSDDEEQPVGRRTYGPAQGAQETPRVTTRRNELEEGDVSDSDMEPLETGASVREQTGSAASSGSTRRPTTTRKSGTATTTTATSTVKTMQGRPSRDSGDEADPIKPSDLVRKAAMPSNVTGWESVQIKDSKPSKQVEAEDEAGEEQLVPSNMDLVRAAFGGDEDEATFEADKSAMAVDEDDKTVSNALPGWGSWVGEGMSKAQQKRNKPRNNTTKIEGVKASDRKDAKLQRVVISEKRMKKNAKYLAPTLPHPFESRQQYERSLRVPIGPEWTTKESFQAATKPRVMVKQGIIKPMARPSI